LALGFNYHSDLVVQQSPKTVRGEIIPLDTLQKPRERPEQLAVSFNYLAEQLVKDSPKTETGEVIIEGVVTTPRRLARDQLAVGFNYHSDQIAKLSSPKEENMDSNEELDIDSINQKNDTLTLMNGDIKDHDNVKSAKRSISDTIAVGFSYNSDQILKESLDKINGNLPNDNVVASLIEDVVIGEGRNIVEVVDDIPVVGLPAGSVW
jgi:DNA-directed RNA polymerase beta' subunit